MIRALLLLAALAACSPAPSTASTQAPPRIASVQLPAETPSWTNAREYGVDFRAMGQEPGWMLDIYAQDRMVLEWSYGEYRIALPLTEAEAAQEGATRYVTSNDQHDVAITIRRAACQDVMSGEAYPATVEVVIDEATTLSGCGRTV